MKYDAVFIGAGISSLYANYLFLKKHPHAKTIILEKSNHIGGRIAWDNFNGVEIATGAGVGRYNKDKLLLELLQEFDISYHVSETRGISSVEAVIKKLNDSRALIKHGGADTFRSFGIRVLGAYEYKRFVKDIGYSDFENFEADTALKHYGFEDMYEKHKIFQFSWKNLINHLKRGMHIKKNTSVIKIKNGLVTAKDVGGSLQIYDASHIFVGVTINCLRKLFPGIYPGIHSQHFIRIYVELNKHLPYLTHYTICDNILQKVIPIKDKLYMIYADNKNADALRPLSRKELSVLLQTEFKDTEIQIIEKRKYYWKEGTHYHSEALVGGRPEPGVTLPDNITIIGELLSKNQGWCGPVLQNITYLSKEQRF